MASFDFAELVKQLVDENPAIQQSAKMAILALDEEAIDSLNDQFFAGVNDTVGLAILDIIAEIGGPDAMSTLRNVFYFEETRHSLQQSAARGLLHNSQSLSPKELDDVESFLSNHA